MDPINERKVFAQLVESACQPRTPQCFLLTPKLLPNLPFTEHVTLLEIYNGALVSGVARGFKKVRNKPSYGSTYHTCSNVQSKLSISRLHPWIRLKQCMRIIISWGTSGNMHLIGQLILRYAINLLFSRGVLRLSFKRQTCVLQCHLITAFHRLVKVSSWLHSLRLHYALVLKLILIVQENMTLSIPTNAET